MNKQKLRKCWFFLYIYTKFNNLFTDYLYILTVQINNNQQPFVKTTTVRSPETVPVWLGAFWLDKTIKFTITHSMMAHFPGTCHLKACSEIIKKIFSNVLNV